MQGLILDHARDGIALLDIYGRILWMNPALERMFGWPMDLMRGRNPAPLINLPDKKPSAEEMATFRYRPDSPLFDRFRITRHIRRDGTTFWNQQSHALIDLGPTDAQKMVVVTCRDISEQVRVQTALEQVRDDLDHAACHDDLTGLGNRKKLSRYLSRPEVRDCIRKGRIGVLQLDLDKFKQINDTLGHAAGDAVLRHVARALSAGARAGDLICRTGGDEFLLICIGIDDRDTLLRRAEALLRATSAPLAWKDQIITPGISVGASLPACGEAHGEDANGTCGGEALIRQADQALYAAKEGGRGRVVLYTEALGARCRAERQLGRDLASAVEQGQFTVHLQPVLHLVTRRVIGCEALLRWQHPARGLLCPADFMPAAKQAGLVGQIDYFAMTASLDALCALRAQGFDEFYLSMNVSGTTLGNADYPALLDWAMQARGVPPGCVCIEVREATISRAAPGVTAAVARLRQLGVRVALDDFGSGYAGLVHMSSAPLDAIKLDRSIVRLLETDPRARIIARSIIRLCALLDVEVIAQGVETQEQLAILGRAKCPMIQGYGLARPMPADTLAAWLRAHGEFARPVTLPVQAPHPAAMPALAPR